MENLIEGTKLIGGIAGILSLGWKVYEEFNGYIKVKVQVSSENKNYSVLTEIENTNKLIAKKIENAFLLISLEQSNLIEAGQLVAKYLELSNNINSTNSFEYLKSDKPLYIDKTIAFIPLGFYYDENIAIGDENLTYRCSLDNEQLNTGQYSVRFYIYGEKRYHRSTQDLLIIN